MVVATILAANISAFTMSNQAFAQPPINIGQLGQSASNSGNLGHSGQLGQVLAEEKELAGHTTKSALGDVCLSCWGGLAEHEALRGKVLGGQITSNLGSGRHTLQIVST